MEEIIIVSDDENIRADLWLSYKLKQYSRAYIQKLIENNRISVNGETIKSNYKIKRNDQFHIIIPEPVKLDIKPEDIKIDVIYEDNDIIVINKPKGMVVHPAPGNYTGTLVNALMKYCGNSLSDINGLIRPGIVHRIDKDTSGLLVVAKNNRAHASLSLMLNKHQIIRIYNAVVKGVIIENRAKVDVPVGRHAVNRKKMSVDIRRGRSAVTHFKVLERFSDATYIELKLETGRTHQIRVHMSYIGYPLIGDIIYGNKKDNRNINGQVLHARKLCFTHPITSEYMEFEAPLPLYFTELLSELRSKKM